MTEPIDRLEPAAKELVEWSKGPDHEAPSQEAVVLTSIAVSLKRIADRLEGRVVTDVLRQLARGNR